MTSKLQRRSISEPSDPALTMWSDFLVFRNSTHEVAVNRASGDFPEHLHEFVEISLIVSGRAIHTMGHAGQEVRKGDIIAALPGRRHSYSNSSKDFNRLIIQIRRACFAELSESLANAGLDTKVFEGIITLQPEVLASCLRMALDMEREWLEAVAGVAALLKFKLGELMTAIARAASGKANAEGSRLLDAIALIDKDYARQIALSELEEVSGMGRRTLERAFKAETGLSPKRYLLKTRIAWACRMLSSGGASIKETAEACGFKEQNYFVRAFRLEVGMTPGRFSKKATE